MRRLMESFACLCKYAAEHGTRIGFEPRPFAMIRTLRESLEMIEGAGVSHGGITFDLWHMVKPKIGPGLQPDGHF
jgi:sugar phosphate isomerase/epimerase